MTSPILIPDLDMDLTVEAKEYTGAVDPSDVAAMTKKENENEKNLVRKGRVLPTQVQRQMFEPK